MHQDTTVRETLLWGAAKVPAPPLVEAKNPLEWRNVKGIDGIMGNV
jgi:hypothetical protein